MSCLKESLYYFGRFGTLPHAYRTPEETVDVDRRRAPNVGTVGAPAEERAARGASGPCGAGLSLLIEFLAEMLLKRAARW
jgi:hypothetical protein